MIFKSCRVSPLPDLSVCFCDARQGGGAYGKTASSQPFTVVLFCSHVLSWLSPDSVDKLPAVIREPPPLAAAPATERSERVGEEAEFLRELDLSTYAPCGLVCWRKRSRTSRDRFRQRLYGCSTPMPYCASKCVCMLFCSSSASSCSRSHMAACSSASRASSFSSSVRLWLLMNRAMLSAVCCCLFTFCRSPFCLCIQHHVIMPCSVLCLDSERFSGCLMFIRSSHRGCRGKALTRL